jgi:hypothetical protein
MNTNAGTQISKAELLEKMRDGRTRWGALLERVGEARMAQPGVDGEMSVKDIIAHVAAYEQWTAEQIRAEITGEMPPPNPDEEAHPDDWMDLDRRNARIYLLNRDLPLDEVMSKSHRAFEQLLAAVEALSEEDLAGPQEWTYGEPVRKIVPVQCYVHYQDHIPAISAWLDNQEG